MMIKNNYFFAAIAFTLCTPLSAAPEKTKTHPRSAYSKRTQTSKNSAVQTPTVNSMTKDIVTKDASETTPTKPSLSAQLKTASLVAAPLAAIICHFLKKYTSNEEGYKALGFLISMTPYALAMTSRATDIADEAAPERCNKDGVIWNMLNLLGLNRLTQLLCSVAN